MSWVEIAWEFGQEEYIPLSTEPATRIIPLNRLFLHMDGTVKYILTRLVQKRPSQRQEQRLPKQVEH